MSLIIKITGASGYLGQKISSSLLKKGYIVSGIPHKILYNERLLYNQIKKSDILINLAGVSVFKRWTKKNMSEIYNSRVKTVKNIVSVINKLPVYERPKKIISASAIGIYLPGETHTEISEKYNNKFIGRVVSNWEKAWENLPETISLTVFRLATVLGSKAIVIKKLKLFSSLRINIHIGSNNYPFPFIHEKDVISAFLWAIEKNKTNGIFNLAAPSNIYYDEFKKILMAFFKKQIITFHLKDWMINIIFKEAVDILTKSPMAIPQALLNKGFIFKYPTIEETLTDILKNNFD